jgi:uncharacterized membrane protein
VSATESEQPLANKDLNLAENAPLVYNAMHSIWRTRIIGFGSAALAAAIVMIVAPSWLTGTARVVAAYDAAAICLSTAFWTLAMHRDSRHAAHRAATEDPGPRAVLAIVLLSALMGMISAISVLGHGPGTVTANEKHVSYALAVTAMLAGWWLIHTIFTFRYAHLFYSDGNDDCTADRGLIFPGTTNPNDFDFAYFAFVIGMTFQVSDVQITDQSIRRMVLLHGLISFVYNTAIIALGINIVSGLVH